MTFIREAFASLILFVIMNKIIFKIEKEDNVWQKNILL